MGIVKRGGCPLLFLVRILLNVTVSATQSGLQAFSSIQFDPPFVHDLIAGKNTTLQVTVGVDSRHEAYPYMLKKLPWRVQLKSMDEEVVSVIDNEKELTFRQLNANASQSIQTNFTLLGHFLGKTAIRVRLLAADEDSDTDELYNQQLVAVGSPPHNGWQVLDVWVSQERNRLIQRIFISTLIILIVIANVLMGCELDLNIVLETIKKPVAPTIGFFCQFIVMPLLAYGIAHVVFVSRGLNSFALGLFVTGCAPGGGASNYWTLLLEGNIHVSVTMTFLSTLAAVVMMPLWIGALGQHFLRGYGPGAQIKVPYTKIVSSLFSLVIPLLIGILIARWKPDLKKKARKYMRPFILFVLVFLVVFGTIANLYMLRLLTWTAVMGGLLLPWCGFTFGCFTAVIMRQPPPNVTAIAIETGIQNTGIAIMLLKFSFPDPDADISSLIPVIAASLTPFPLLGAVGVHAVMRRLRYTENNKQQQANITVVEHEMPDKQAIPTVLDVEEGSPLVQRLNNTLNLPIGPCPAAPSDSSLATRVTEVDA